MSQTSRAKFMAKANQKDIAARAWDAMIMASTHDPDHSLEIKCLKRDVNIIFSKLETIDRQLERLGAPQYRIFRKGKTK